MTLINKCKTDTIITKLKSEIKILSTNTKWLLVIYLLILFLVLKSTFIH
jgi:hypothetical protein